MKNRNAICTGLLLAIIFLIGIALCYYVVMSKKTDEPIIGENSFNASVDEQPNFSLIKTIDTFSDFNRYINRDTESFIVFGKENCSFCSQYKPVLEQIAKNYNLEIIYINMTKLSEDDYYNVLNSDLDIPAKCSKDGVDTKLSNGFGTPLNLFVKNGRTYDCIRGYKDYETLEILLRTIGYIKRS